MEPILKIISWVLLQLFLIWFIASYTLHHHLTYLIWKNQTPYRNIKECVKQIRGNFFIVITTVSYYQYIKSRRQHSNYRATIGFTGLIFLGAFNILAVLTSLERENTWGTIAPIISTIMFFALLFYMKKCISYLRK